MVFGYFHPTYHVWWIAVQKIKWFSKVTVINDVNEILEELKIFAWKASVQAGTELGFWLKGL